MMDLENSSHFLINDLNSYSDLNYKARNYKVKAILSDKITINPNMTNLEKKIINGLDFSSDAFHNLCVEHTITSSKENEASKLNNDDIIKYITINTIENTASILSNDYKDIFYKYGLDSKNYDQEYFYTKLFYRYFLGYEYLPINARNKQKKTKELIVKANALESYLTNALTNVLTNYGFNCIPTKQFRNIEPHIVKQKLYDSLKNSEVIELDLFNDAFNKLLSFSKTKENYWKPSLSPKDELRNDVCEMSSAKLVSERTGIPLDYLYKMINGQKPITSKNLAKIYSKILNGSSSAYNYVYYISGEETQREINRLYFKAKDLISSKILNHDLSVDNLVKAKLYNPSYDESSVLINTSDCNNVYEINFNYAPLLDALELLRNKFYNNKLQTGVEMTPTLIEDLLKDIKVIKKIS